MDPKALLKHSWIFIQQHTPEILTGAAVAGTVASVIFTAKNTPKAVMLLEEAQRQKGQEPLTFGEKVKATWKVYIPTVVTAGGAIACMVGSNVSSNHRNAALLGLYTASQEAMSEYQKKVVEEIGKKKEDILRTEAQSEQAKKLIAPEGVDPDSKTIIKTGLGNELCYDVFSGRLFWSDIEALRRAENDINRDLVAFNTCSLNDAYIHMGLRGIGCGEDIGFTVDGMFKFRFGSMLLDGERAVLTVDFEYPPQPGYNKLW